MDKKITAEWAKNTAINAISEQVAKEIATCENEIKRAVDRNQMNCIVGIYGQPKTISELVKRGFKVEQHDDQRDGSYISISWE